MDISRCWCVPILFLEEKEGGVSCSPSSSSRGGELVAALFDTGRGDALVAALFNTGPAMLAVALLEKG